MIVEWQWSDADADSEKEFENLREVQVWLQGQREEDFSWIYLYDNNGNELAASFLQILELK